MSAESRPLVAALAYGGQRIVGGSEAARGQFPHQAALTVDYSSFCGGSLVSPRWLLTAAHCAYGASIWRIYLGGVRSDSASEAGRITITSYEAIVHEQYDPYYITRDVAVINLGQDVELTAQCVANQPTKAVEECLVHSSSLADTGLRLSAAPIVSCLIRQQGDYIQPIQLPPSSLSTERFLGETLTISGWGYTSDDSYSVSAQLMYVRVGVLSNAVCQLYYGGSVLSSTLCTSDASTKGTCGGDSGGPVVRTNEDGSFVLLGVVSYGSIYGCERNYPSGHARVTSFLDWISEKTGIAIS
ncbi:brachyurin-like [Schistocerca cancellata]|uniref:brachyurin-like n=1 Tax=Schistocerca cancellata TaxID=274614 RepID=UPI0021191473|nr:brachyurin-like [Schistocerca cancellata]